MKGFMILAQPWAKAYVLTIFDYHAKILKTFTSQKHLKMKKYSLILTGLALGGIVQHFAYPGVSINPEYKLLTAVSFGVAAVIPLVMSLVVKGVSQAARLVAVLTSVLIAIATFSFMKVLPYPEWLSHLVVILSIGYLLLSAMGLLYYIAIKSEDFSFAEREMRAMKNMPPSRTASCLDKKPNSTKKPPKEGVEEEIYGDYPYVS